MRVLEEYLARLEQGAPPSPEELVHQHPELADRLQEFLASLEFLHRAALNLHSGDQAEGAVAAAPELGELGDFRIVREIGRGGMGVVYEAEQISLGRRVALKVLPFAGALDPKQLQRFKNEAQAAAHLHHQNIVPVHAVGCERGVHYYAMQFIEGRTLAAVIHDLRQRGGLQAGNSVPSTGYAVPAADTGPRAAFSTELGAKSPAFFRTVANLGIQAAQALEYAHSQGIIHRDIKPANLLIDSPGNVWITDFGLARAQGDAGLTMTGDLVGTMRYMSPEQAEGQHFLVDHRTDIYSLGVTLYELLTLEPAFPGNDRQELLRQITDEEPHSPRQVNPGVPVELETILGKAIAKSREERYATAQELADDLERFLDDKPIRARRPTLLHRLKKWGRRHRPVVWAAAVSAFAVLAVAVTALAVSNRAINATLSAETKAKEEKEEALKRSAQMLYFHRIALAEREAAANHWGRVDALLDECPEDLRGWEWYYLNHLRHSSPIVLKPNLGGLLCAISPDGRRVAAGGNETSENKHDVMVWDIATGQLLFIGRGHTDLIGWVAFSPDGCQLASGSRDKTARIWDLTGSLTPDPSLDPSPTKRGPGQDAELPLPLRDGRTAGAEGKAKVIAPRLTLVGHTKPGIVVAFSPNGRLLATTNPDQTVRLWDTRTGQQLHCFPGFIAELARLGGNSIVRLAFSPDGRHLASGSGDREIKVWDVNTGQTVLTLRGHQAPVPSVRYSPDGRHLASICLGRKVKLWDLTTGQELWTRPQTQEVAFDRTGQRMAVPQGDYVEVLEAVSGRDLIRLEGHASMEMVAFSPDGQRLVTASRDNTVKVWDASTGHEALTLYAHQDEVYRAEFTPDGQRIISASKYDGTLRIWAAPRQQEDTRGQFLVLRGYGGPVPALAFGRDSRLLASASEDRTVRVWDAVNGQLLWSRQGHTDRVWTVAFHPEGRRVVSLSSEQIKFWDASSGQELYALPDQTSEGGFWSLSLHPAGHYLAVSCFRALKVRAVADGAELWSIPAAHEGAGIGKVAFSPDGTQLASAGMDRLVKVWDARTGEKLLELKGHTQHRLFALAYTPDGRFLATGGKDRTVRIWDLTTGQTVHVLGQHVDYVLSVAFSPDGRYLASAAGADVKIWDPTTGREVTTLRGHAGRVCSVAFSPDGQRLAAGSGYARKGEVRIWNVAAFGQPPGQEQ
jgi:WD40 repeat protein/serine/threonine protein kinase